MDVNNYATSYLEGKSVRVCKPLSLIAVALLVSVLFVGMAQVAAAGAGDSMQFRYDAAHTCDYSPVAGSTLPIGQPKWAVWTEHLSSYPHQGGTWLTSPVVGNGIRQRSLQSSFPAVVNGVVFTASYRDDDFCGALDAATGKLVWRFRPDNGERIDVSPAVVNGIVYTASEGKSEGNKVSHVYALDAATGKEVWRFARPSEDTDEWGGVQFGSPVVANGMVYVPCDDFYVYALNAATGKEV